MRRTQKIRQRGGYVRRCYSRRQSRSPLYRGWRHHASPAEGPSSFWAFAAGCDSADKAFRNCRRPYQSAPEFPREASALRTSPTRQRVCWGETFRGFGSAPVAARRQTVFREQPSKAAQVETSIKAASGRESNAAREGDMVGDAMTFPLKEPAAPGWCCFAWHVASCWS